MAPALRGIPRGAVGHDDPGVPRRGCPERGVVAGDDLRQSTPIFFLVSPKKTTAVESSKAKGLGRCAVTGAERPPAQRDAALNRPTQLR